MKAISLRQPWAHLVTLGLKTVEIRTWSTHYRGPLAVHAAKKLDERAAIQFGLGDLPGGAVVGTIELVDVEPFTSESWVELAGEHLDPGAFPGDHYAWILANPVELETPIPCSGKLGLFDVELDLATPAGVQDAGAHP